MKVMTLSVPDEGYDFERITFIRYAQSQTIGDPNHFKVLGSKKTKGTNYI
jgi:hypothetical protein